LGKFFAFDGIDRSGKSTAIENVAARLVDRGESVELLKSGNICGRRAVDYLGTYPDEIVYMLLWQAHRLLDLTEVQPAIAAGKIVLCDRYELSNLAHNWWFDLDSAFQNQMQSVYLALCTPPDLYCVFTIPYATFLERDDGDTLMTADEFRIISQQYGEWAERLAVSNICKIIFVDGTMSEEALCDFLMPYIDEVLVSEAS